MAPARKGGRVVKMSRAEKAIWRKVTRRGGLARAAALSPERRKEIATMGAKARWAKRASEAK